MQRLTAMNLFLDDIYHHRKILKDGVVPAELVLKNDHYRPEMDGVDLKHGTYIHICGVDIIRDQEPVSFGSWKTMGARRQASPMWSKTGI